MDKTSQDILKKVLKREPVFWENIDRLDAAAALDKVLVTSGLGLPDIMMLKKDSFGSPLFSKQLSPKPVTG